jgi:aminopeptidase N
VKKNIFIFLLPFFIYQICYSQKDNHFVFDNEKVARMASSYNATCSQSGNYDVRYYRCCWNIDPAVNAISGSVTMYFMPLSSLDSMQMDVSVSLTVDSVLYHQSKTNFTQQTGDVLQINFSSTLSDLDSVTVYYHGVPQTTGFGSFVQSTHGPNNTPVIWTLSEPYGASDWWPCKNTLTDKADSIDTYITIPPGNKAASNGLLKEIIPNGTNYTYHWKHRHPIAAYLVAQGVTNYSTFLDTAKVQQGTLPVLYYTYPEDSASARTSDGQLLQVIHYYDSLFIPYAFSDEKYGHAEFGWGGGMEHQTMSFVGGFPIYLLVHELAHQWFGDRVTCGSWHDIWLNEGFAVYCSAISQTTLFGEDFFTSWKVSTMANITSIANGSVWVDDTTSVSRIFDGRLTYNKGAYLLHMLRWKLGDSLFFQGLRNYLSDPTLAYSFSKTIGLQQHLESISGQSLTNFINQWFYGQGYPSYLILYSKEANNQYKITINQTTSDNSVSFFEMPVPIQFKGQGKDTMIVFNHTSSGQVFYANLNFTPDSILFDPNLEIISLHNRVMEENAYLRSLQSLVIYPNPATDVVNVEVNDFNNFPRTVELYNVFGQKLLSLTPIENAFSVPLYGLASGTYYLKIISGEKVYTQKIVKE